MTKKRARLPFVIGGSSLIRHYGLVIFVILVWADFGTPVFLIDNGPAKCARLAK